MNPKSLVNYTQSLNELNRLILRLTRRYRSLDVDERWRETYLAKIENIETNLSMLRSLVSGTTNDRDNSSRE